jgi:hypothetical protein
MGFNSAFKGLIKFPARMAIKTLNRKLYYKTRKKADTWLPL